jgi:hypothetical protein
LAKNAGGEIALQARVAAEPLDEAPSTWMMDKPLTMPISRLFCGCFRCGDHRLR